MPKWNDWDVPSADAATRGSLKLLADPMLDAERLQRPVVGQRVRRGDGRAGDHDGDEDDPTHDRRNRVATYDRGAMKVLLVTLYFPPAGGGGVQRPLKFATHLPALGIETHVLAPDDPKWIHRDADLPPPTQAWVHRARYVGPRGRRPAEELHGTPGLERASRQAAAARPAAARPRRERRAGT